MAVDPISRRSTPAVVMNMFYTGLGIARSLGEHGVRVFGLSAERGIYGNFSRHATVIAGADSRREPDRLLGDLTALGQRLGGRSVLFPTRDHDLVFLDRFRAELEPYYVLAVPAADALHRCLNKWATYRSATEAGVATPQCWLLEGVEDVTRAAHEIRYPCVLKPIEAHHWRTENGWELVGARKAIAIDSPDQLRAEYAAVARADRRALVQELVPGADDRLFVAACYVDRRGSLQAGFSAQKLRQTPPGFGTGCIVQSIERPELLERTTRLLHAMQFNGIAEVEYKWDERDSEYKLIEVNPRPWDQHPLGRACGVDLVHVAYCDYAGLPKPPADGRFTARKWIAEDAFVMAALRLLWRREPGIASLFRQARGKRMYAIWSVRDPLPFLVWITRLVPELIGIGLKALRRTPAARGSAGPNAAVRAIQ